MVHAPVATPVGTRVSDAGQARDWPRRAHCTRSVSFEPPAGHPGVPLIHPCSAGVLAGATRLREGDPCRVSTHRSREEASARPTTVALRRARPDVREPCHSHHDLDAEQQPPARAARGPAASEPAGGVIAGAAPTPKAVALVLLPALVLMLAFAFSYVGAFHEPTPHNVPLAVVGPAPVATQLDQLPGDPLDTRGSPSRSDALSQIDDRKVYGAYEAATNRLYVASAANRATAIALERTFDRVAAARGQPAVRVTDVKPLPPKDPNGTAAFYAVIAWVFGGYIGATLIGVIGTPRSRSHARGAARIGAFAGFALVAGILSVILLR